MEKINAVHAHHQLAGDYAKTLALLAALKTGEVVLDQIQLIENGWMFVNAAKPPVDVGEPIKTNGELPEPIAERMGL